MPQIGIGAARRWVCAAALLFSVLNLSAASGQASDSDWPTTASESLPPVTVRWEDPRQIDTFIVEGANYRCRIATSPARILSLEVNGKEVFGPDGAQFSLTDSKGVHYTPAPPGFAPRWNVWRRKWTPATNSRARMNVWKAGLYYWDAHLLDIPFVSDATQNAIAASGAPVADWDFADGLGGWAKLHDSTITANSDGTVAVQTTGADPSIQSPTIDAKGPLTAIVRLRTEQAGVAQVYWLADAETTYSEANSVTVPVIADGAWHEYRFPITNIKQLKSIRFDPPGVEAGGTSELKAIRLISRPGDDAYRDPPLRGHIIFHAFPDQLRIQFKVDGKDDPADTGNASAVDASLFFTTNELPIRATRGSRQLVTLNASSAALLGDPKSSYETKSGTWTAPLTTNSGQARSGLSDRYQRDRRHQWFSLRISSRCRCLRSVSPVVTGSAMTQFPDSIESARTSIRERSALSSRSITPIGKPWSGSKSIRPTPSRARLSSNA